MRKKRRSTSRSFETLENRLVLDSTVVFNELMYHPAESAGESLEWIELYNQLAVDMDISEWSLRGGVEYEFPDGTVVPGRGYLVVAADPDELEAAAGLSNTMGPYLGRLDNNGESLKLFNNDDRLMNEVRYGDDGPWPVGPDGSGVSLAKFNQRTASHDPASWTTSLQIGGTPGNSNFFEDGTIRLTTLVPERVPATAFVPADNSLGRTWTELGFDDSAWTTGRTGIGYERNSGYESFLGLDLDDPPGNQPAITMHDVNESAYVRVPFTLNTDLSTFDSIVLRMKFDDGFVGYLNGQEIARDNAPASVTWNSGANGSRSDGNAVSGADFDITAFVDDFVQGQNVLAIHGLNQSETSSDFLILPEIVGVEEIDPDNPDISTLGLAINEVQAADEGPFWIELANDTSEAIDLAGLVLHATGPSGGDYTFPQQSLPAGGLLVVNQQQLGYQPEDGERLFLYAPDKQRLVDAREVTNRVRGRAAEADNQWLYPTAATPGSPNQFALNDQIVINEIMYHAPPQLSKPGTSATYETTSLLPIDATWLYNESGDDLGASWHETTYASDNVDWFSGRGLLGFEDEPLPEPLRTELTDPRAERHTTYYFQTQFGFDGNLNGASDLVLRHVVDDGVIIYLNGAEVARFNMRGGNVNAGTLASGTVGEATYSSPISIPANLLQAGTNILSAELHQATNNSSDFVFGAELSLRGELTPAVPGVPFAKSDEEWIELYNRSSQAVDLSDWKLEEAVQYKFDDGTVLGPGQFLVIARDADDFAAKYPRVAVDGSYSGSLSNSGDQLRLIDANKNPVDMVAYLERGEWPAYADGGGSSLELRDPLANNSKGGAWAASDETGNSSWAQYSVSKVTGSDLVGPLYNEFIFGLLDSGEFLIDDVSVVESGRELIQNGSFEADSIGQEPDKWRLIGNHSGVVVADPDDANNLVLHVIASGAQAHVHDHAETTFIGNRSIRTNATYDISFRAKWLAGNSQLNNRLYFTRISNTVRLDIPDQYGTPGEANSTLVSNLGPTFDDLAHGPVVPSAGQSVTVDVNMSDPNGIDSATLWWNVNGGAWNSVAMTDQGDDLYQASIPGQSSNRVVQFYVEGIDGLGAASTYPAAGPDSRALYQVRGAGSTGRPIDTLQIIMLSSDESTLFSNVNRMSNNYQGATLVHNGTDVYYDIEVRQVGSRFIRPNSGYKVRLNPAQKFYGVHDSIRFDINGLKEVVYKQMINRAGGSSVSLYDDIAYLVSPRSGHSGAMLLNLARYEDVYLNEQFDDGGDGTKWELDDVTYPTDPSPSPEGLKTGTGVSSPDIMDRGTDQEAYRGHLLIKNNRSQDDYSRLVEMAQAIHKSGNQLYNATNEVMDVDLWMRHYATQAFLGNWDTYGFRRPKNLRIYERPSDRKIIPLAWDFDLANLTEPLIYNGGATRLDEIRNLPQNERLFWGHMWDLTQVGFNAEYIGRWASHYGSLTGSNYSGETSDVRNRVNQARSQARSAIPQIAFEISTNSGRDFSVTDHVATVEGTGWIDVRQIIWKEADIPLDVTWTSDNDWQVEIPVNQGDNAITLEAIDLRGGSTGQDTITITSSVSNQIADSLRITEINYNPYDPTAAELLINPALDNDDFEFIEVQNIGIRSINLLQSRVTNGVDYVFPEVELEPGDFGLIVRNAEAFELRYGDRLPVIGEYSGGLNNGGEGLTLVDAQGMTVIDIDYGDNNLWPQRADGVGGTLVLRTPATTPPSQFGKYYSWQGSTEFGGSPGAMSAAPIGVVVNEVLAHTDPPITESDSIELLNISDQAIDLSGWYISDSDDNLLKYQIPPGSVLPAGAYIVFNESDFNPTPLDPGPNDFGLSGAHGDDVWVTTAGANGNILSFIEEVHFGATPNGESLGRVPDGRGRLAPMSEPTLGRANASVRTGPVILSEVHYAPADPSLAVLAIDPTVTADDLEYVEIHNPTAEQIDLTDWRIRGGIDYDFEQGQILAAGETFVLVPFNPDRADNQQRTAAFRANYSITPGTRLVGGYAGRLRLSGERVELQRPDSPPLEEPNFIPRLWEDQVTYDNLSPWPDAASNGNSIHRTSTIAYGNAPNSWTAATPSPGTYGSTVDADFNDDGTVDVIDVDLLCGGIRDADQQFDLTGDGRLNGDDVSFLIENVLHTTVGDSNIDGLFDSTDLVQIFQAGQYEDTIAGNSTWSSGDWNCDGDFTTTDLVLAFQSGVYTSNAVASLTGAQDPAAAILAQTVRSATTESHDQQVANPLLASRNSAEAVDLALQSMTDSLFDDEVYGDDDESWQELALVDELDDEIRAL